MYIFEQETKFGVIKWVCADKGKKILLFDELVDRVAMGVHSTLDDYTEVEDAYYIPPEIPQEDEEISLTELQENQITLSKSNLRTYLEENPLFSTLKDEKGKYYNVTQEKQTLLFMELFKYSLNPNHTLYWNAVGETYEEWTFEELKDLSLEIERYIRPFIKLQQELELSIRHSISNMDILSLDLNPYKEVMI